MLNQATIVGKITKTPEIMENQDGSKFAILNLAVPRNFKNKNGEYETDFIDCALWTGIVENVCKYCKKGDIVGVKGRIQNINNTAQLQLIAEKVSYLNNKEE